jgi:bifunctional non-homologous end joining protein LigD
MTKSSRATTPHTAPPPTWIKPQLAKLVDKAPDGSDWLHEIKFDGYRMHARFDAGSVQILTRRGNNWTDKYPAIAKAIAGLPARNAYLDGELCGLLPDGRTSFNLIQNVTDTGEGSLVFFLFDLLHLSGEDLTALPLVERKSRLKSLLKGALASLRYNDHQIGHGPAFHRLACEHGVEGIVSKRLIGRYEPDRRTWLKVKCLNREEFVVVGFSDPEGADIGLGRCCSGTTPRRACSFTQAEPGPVTRGRVGAPLAAPSAIGGRQNTAGRVATARHSVRITAGA